MTALLGTIGAIAAWIVAACIPTFVVWLSVRRLCRERPRPPLPSDSVWGDVVNFPSDLKISHGGETKR